MQCPAPPWVAACVAGSLDALYAQQTAPFVTVFQDHMRCMQQLRELQVRLAQLDKEGAELREENADLHRKLEGVDEARDRAAAAEAEAAKARVVQLEREVTQLYKDKSRLLEELVAAGGDLTASKHQVQALEVQLAQSVAKVADLQSQLASTSAALTHERMSREAAADEVAGAMAAKEHALQETERLQAENAKLIKRLVELKENEVERMNQINHLHEEALQQATMLRREAAADKEAAEMIRARLMNSPLHHPASSIHAAPAGLSSPQHPASGTSQAGLSAMPNAAGGVGAVDGSQGQQGTGSRPGSGPGSAGGSMTASVVGLGGPATAPSAGSGTSLGSHVSSAAAADGSFIAPLATAVTTAAAAAAAAAASAAAALAPGVKPVTLKDTMALPDVLDLSGGCQRVLPKAPYKSVVAHKGGCCSLASQNPGHLVASCGANTSVLLWNASVQGVGLMAPHSSSGSSGAWSTLSGMTGTVHDVTFTCDGLQVLAAGADKSLHLWDVASGQTRHTLTGHSAAVTGASAGPMDSRVAASCSEDRCIKVWDLSRGFCIRSLPCTKMPGCVLMLKDGNTIASGHVDGTVCLWDVRQGRSGTTQPALECRDHTQAICGLSPAYSDTVVLVASRDHTLTMWDYRTMSCNQVLKGPGFTVGTVGSMGRGRCHIEMSVDGHFVAAGSGDGAVHVWDLSRPSVPGRGAPAPTVLRYHTEAVVAASWSSDVSVLVTADKGGTVAMWSLVG